jgi:fluoroacetyl-CoA thioesterase
LSSEIRPGLKGEAHTLVSRENTANRIASGIAEVYATPMMIALLETAASNAVSPVLMEGQSTVGTLVNVKHLAATPLGHRVRAEAELTEVEGRRLVFRVEAFDETEKIGEGTHERFIIDMDRFMERVQKKSKTSQPEQQVQSRESAAEDPQV